MKHTETIYNHILSLVWLLLFILPTNLIFYVFVPISFIILFNYKMSIQDKGIKLIIISIISLLILSIISNIHNPDVTNKDYFRVIVLILFFITFSQLNGCKIIKPYIYISVVFLIATQLAFLLNISFLVDFIKTYYPYEGDRNMYETLESVQISDLANTRLGGIFYNPNQYARYLELILITLLCEIKQFRKKELFIIFPLFIISLIITGSRTSLIVFMFIILTYMFFMKKITIKYLIIIGFVGIVILGFLYVTFADIQDLRIFKINEGMDNSFGVKVDLLKYYLNQDLGILDLIGGKLSLVLHVSSSAHEGTDFDIGNIIISYGIVFFILFIIFCVVLYHKMQNQYRIVFIILIWMFSSSIICSYRMAPLFFLILGLYYRRSILAKIS